MVLSPLRHMGSSYIRDRTCVSCIGRWPLYHWAIREALSLFFELSFLLFSHSVMSNPLRPMDCNMPGFHVLHHLLEFAQTHVLWVRAPSNLLNLCCPFLLLPSIFPSIRVLSKESALCIRWPKYWSFSFSTNPFNEYSGLISFRTDWVELLAVQGTLKSLLQHHSLKASIFLCSTFFMVQLSHPYITTGKKTIGLTRWTFVGKVMSILLNMLSRIVIIFLEGASIF